MPLVPGLLKTTGVIKNNNNGKEDIENQNI